MNGDPAGEMAIVSHVVMMTGNGVIGRNGHMPWNLPADLKWFRRLTFGKPIIMGRKTFQSIGKPLDGRCNIVLSRGGMPSSEGLLVATTIKDALDIARREAESCGSDEIAIIGGGQVYAETWPMVDRVHLGIVADGPDIQGDTFYNCPDPSAWRETARYFLPRDGGNERNVIYVTLQRRTSRGGGRSVFFQPLQPFRLIERSGGSIWMCARRWLSRLVNHFR